jgi:hypothetical protein
MPTGLEKRIRELCANAVAAKDSEELIPILSELRAALYEQDQLAKVLIAERTRMLNPNVNRKPRLSPLAGAPGCGSSRRRTGSQRAGIAMPSFS